MSPPLEHARPRENPGRWRRRAPALLACAALVAFAAIAAEERIVHAEKSPFGTVYVVDEGDRRYLRFDRPDGNDQSLILKSNPAAVPLEYVRVAAAGLALTPGRERALVMGLGGGSFPMLLRRKVPGMAVEVVDINPVVVDVARRFFGVREDEQLHITVDDGGHFMKQPGPRYDVMLLDAYSDAGIPEHLQAREFFEDVKRRLAPRGAAIINIALISAEAEARLIRRYANTFEGCVLLRGKTLGNVILVGTREPAPSETALRGRLRRLGPELGLPDLEQTVESVEDCVP